MEFDGGKISIKNKDKSQAKKGNEEIDLRKQNTYIHSTVPSCELASTAKSGKDIFILCLNLILKLIQLFALKLYVYYHYALHMHCDCTYTVRRTVRTCTVLAGKVPLPVAVKNLSNKLF